MLPLEGRRLDGKFRFLSSLGSGGMASVYLAVNERVDREVAIKFLRPEVGRDPEAVARFRSEARAAGRIGNRHICEILDLGDSPIGPYIVMERLRGVDLAALIKQQTRLQPGYAVRVARHALEGLAAAHAAGIVHRDLKPGNIFLHRDESGNTIVKLMDFGVSKFLDGSNEAQTASGILLGTPEYMAPEQLEGAHKIGPSADIFAMGAILYRGITGHQVFSGPNLAAVLRSMALDEVTPVSRLVDGVPPELEAIIHRCLHRDIPTRYPDAGALSDALEPFEEFAGQVTVRPEPPPVRQIDPEFVGKTAVFAGSQTSQPAAATSLLPDSQASQAGAASSPSASASEVSSGAGPQVSATAPTGVQASASATEVAGPRAQAEEDNKRSGLWVWLGVGLLGLAVVFGVRMLMEKGSAETDEPTKVAESGSSVTQLPGPPSEVLAVDTSLPNLDEETQTGEAGGTEVVEIETGVIEDETETGEDGESGEDGAEGESGDASGDTEAGKPYVPSTTRPAPAGTFRAGPYISPNDPGPTSDLASAKAYCAGLASRRHGGQKGWRLANPAQLAKFIGNLKTKRARYWTTALNKGNAWTYSLPGGKKESEKATRKVARALCVTKY